MFPDIFIKLKGQILKRKIVSNVYISVLLTSCLKFKNSLKKTNAGKIPVHAVRAIKMQIIPAQKHTIMQGIYYSRNEGWYYFRLHKNCVLNGKIANLLYMHIVLSKILPYLAVYIAIKKYLCYILFLLHGYETG